MQSLRVCHVIGSLDAGGAQAMLVKVLSRLGDRSVDSQVVSLMKRGPMGQPLRRLDVPVSFLGVRTLGDVPRAVLRLSRLLADLQPDVVQTWLYYSDLVGGLAAKLAPSRPPVVWNIRTNALVAGIHRPSLLTTARMCAWLSSSLPARIVVNSVSGLQWHARFGYDRSRLQLIRNGFDTERFRPSELARRAIRRQLGLPDSVRLVGMISSVRPQKDHATFLDAAALLAHQLPDVRFLLCGDGAVWQNESLRLMIEQRRLTDRIHLLGLRGDMPVVQASLDVAVLASVVEGFPNAIGEAMACGVPCVVTDVGDSADLVGDVGFVVPRGDAVGLAQRCRELLTLPPDQSRERGLRSRLRIRRLFDLERVVEDYVALWHEVARRRFAVSPGQGRRDGTPPRRAA
ncbi:MAG TPA: glycosyltransferase [Planctomycetaceae bacterium]|nr:glycosyltransferase [Planctomycetaceae bacterium]